MVWAAENSRGWAFIWKKLVCCHGIYSLLSKDTCLALTIFREGFDLLFILRFATLLFTKIFHWIIGDRVEFMDQTEPSRQFHLKMISIMILFLIVDVAMLWSAIQTILLVGPSMLIVFGFEYALLIGNMLTLFAKYVWYCISIRFYNPLICIDLRRGKRSQPIFHM